jgi:hypothetical protein
MSIWVGVLPLLEQLFRLPQQGLPTRIPGQQAVSEMERGVRWTYTLLPRVGDAPIGLEQRTDI